jgi:hypothetical protein
VWHNKHVWGRGFYRQKGYKKPLPRYYKEKIFNKMNQSVLSAVARKKYDEKMLSDKTDESIKNYWRNLGTSIENKNRRFKRKTEEGGTL